MGKKSKRKGNKSVSSATKGLSNLHIPSENASCWICLDDGESEALVRECACRGDSGWVHLSCIINYAESKSEDWLKKNGMAYWGTGMDKGGSISTISDSDPWMRCPNCKQGYLNQFAIDLVKALVAFTKRRFPWDPSSSTEPFPCDPFKYDVALGILLTTLYHSSDQGKLDTAEVLTEGRKVVEEWIVPLNAKMMKCMNHSRIQQSRERITMSMAHAFMLLGDFIIKGVASNDIDQQEGAEEAIRWYEKSKELFKSIGIDHSVGVVESKIFNSKSFLTKRGSSRAPNPEDIKQNIKNLERHYKMFPSDSTKLQLSMGLLAGGRCIEAQRMNLEILTNSRQVNGMNHTHTVGSEENYMVITTRRVNVRGKGNKYFKLIEYTSAGGKCVVRGPMTYEGWGNEGKTFTVSIGDVTYLPPVPVVCQGLKGASHLNGKIGDAREFNDDVGRYKVYFEDTKLKSVLVKKENLRVLFELPEKE